MGKLSLVGYVKQGLRIASGLNKDPNLKLNNTIFLQKPFFITAKVPYIKKIYNGTINFHVGPREFKIKQPDYVITCEWHPGITETFWLINADVEFKNKVYKGYIYYPCPSLIKSHKDDTVELLTEKIEDLRYGDPITCHVSDESIYLI